jgi:hypothetical protein
MLCQRTQKELDLQRTISMFAPSTISMIFLLFLFGVRGGGKTVVVKRWWMQ